MKPYQKFMGGKTNFLYLRICCYFHLVPVCANFRFWLLCVCVLRDLFISVKAGDTFCEHFFLICSIVLTIRALCSDWSVVMSMIGVRTLSRHRFNANLVLKIASCTSVSMFPLNHFGSNLQKQNTYTFLRNSICLLKTAMGGHEGFAWLSESHKGRGVRGIDWDTLCAISG